MRADMGRGINFCRSRDHGAGMNAGGEFWFRKEDPNRLGKRHARIRHANQDFSAGRCLFSGDDRGGGAVFGRGKIIVVLGECQVAWLGAIGGGKSGEAGIGVADNLGSQDFRNFRSGD